MAPLEAVGRREPSSSLASNRAERTLPSLRDDAHLSETTVCAVLELDLPTRLTAGLDGRSHTRAHNPQPRYVTVPLSILVTASFVTDEHLDPAEGKPGSLTARTAANNGMFRPSDSHVYSSS